MGYGDKFRSKCILDWYMDPGSVLYCSTPMQRHLAFPRAAKWILTS